MRILLPAVCLAAALVAYPSAQSDLDALMSDVLTRRDDNWKKLQQYTLTERENLQITALAVFRLFGFERAVAHGMWSMARAFAALGAAPLAPPVRAQVEFKFPLFLPSAARLEHWTREAREVFVLKDVESDRPHLAGSTLRA